MTPDPAQVAALAQLVAWFSPAGSRSAALYAARIERAEPWADTVHELEAASTPVV